MPELPDVESFRIYFDKTSLKKKIERIDVFAPKMLKDISVDSFKKNIIGQQFISSKRHGKYFFAALDNRMNLALHFGMTGFLNYFKDREDESKHIRLLFTFSNGYHLAYDNQRKFGSINLIESREDFIKEKQLGPDPLADGFNLTVFYDIMKSKKGVVKTTLMDQSNIAGIGNIYADEILFQTAIHPEKNVRKLDEKELKNLFNSILRVLKTAIENDAEPQTLPDTYLLNHRKKGDECPKCGGEIKTKTVGGRTSYFCPDHQN